MNSMKRQKDMKPQDEHPPPHQPWSEDVQYTTGEEQRRIIYSSRKNRAVGPNRDDVLL